MKGLVFVDKATVHVFAGNGGNGVATFRREKFEPHGGPSGGDGGRGGHVILRASKDENSLLSLFYQPHQRADHGEPGRSKDQHGRNGKDRVVRVPCGTTIHLADSGDWIGEVVKDGDEMIVARGGRGGLGNCHFATSTHQAPQECTPGQPGEIKDLRLELKIVADAGLVGYPNAGKSTLLGAISHAHPKVGAYPFTTLHPVVGTVMYPEEYRSLTVADIPGLIEGAHRGVGLGHEFLRHIERTAFLVFVIDMAGVDGRPPVSDYRTLRRELELYSPELSERPHMIVANKMDCPEAAERLEEFIRETGERPFEMAAATGQGVDRFKQALYNRFFVDMADGGAPTA